MNTNPRTGLTERQHARFHSGLLGALLGILLPLHAFFLTSQFDVFIGAISMSLFAFFCLTYRRLSTKTNHAILTAMFTTFTIGAMYNSSQTALIPQYHLNLTLWTGLMIFFTHRTYKHH